MNQLRFDENLAIREVLDDIIGMVDRRERLIESTDQQAEKARDERMAVQVKQLAHLMSNFLVLFSPILVKVRAYGERLRESVSESEAFLRSLVGIIDAGKTVDGSSATMKELEKDADEVEYELKVSTETLNKIEDLFKRARVYGYSESSEQPTRKPEPEFKSSTETRKKIHDQSKVTGPYSHAEPALEPKATFKLSDETRSRIEDLFNKPGTFQHFPDSQDQMSNDEHSSSRMIAPGSESRRLRPFGWAAPRPSTDEPSQG